MAEDSDEEENHQDMRDPAGPRIVTIRRSDTGFGFNVRGQVSEGGQLKRFVFYQIQQFLHKLANQKRFFF